MEKHQYSPGSQCKCYGSVKHGKLEGCARYAIAELEFIIGCFEAWWSEECPEPGGLPENCPRSLNDRSGCMQTGKCWSEVYRQEYRMKQNGGSK